jgi:hypothetical protein
MSGKEKDEIAFSPLEKGELLRASEKQVAAG